MKKIVVLLLGMFIIISNTVHSQNVLVHSDQVKSKNSKLDSKACAEISSKVKDIYPDFPTVFLSDNEGEIVSKFVNEAEEWLKTHPVEKKELIAAKIISKETFIETSKTVSRSEIPHYPDYPNTGDADADKAQFDKLINAWMAAYPHEFQKARAKEIID